MAPITTSQMRKIYVTAKERGMDSDLLHIHIQMLTGKESLKQLTISEAVKVIDSLEGKVVSDRKMTDKQFWYIQALMRELGWTDEEGKPDFKRLDGFCSKYYRIDHYKWLTPSVASKVIEGLKNMQKNKEEQA
ncbi:MAG: regulatory protein GemA [Roseburia sp.]|nr:regulatory protein GemA [Roseburia sp.]